MTERPSERPSDPRAARTRSAIVGSFNELALSQPIDSISVPKIIDEAGVGRSTFYEHFRNTEELLKHAATRMLTPMADAAAADGTLEGVGHVVLHVHENRAAALGMLRGESGVAIERRLAELIEERLEANPVPRRLPPRLLATQCAAAQLALVREWLSSLDPTTPEALARTLFETSRALVAAAQIGP